MEQTILNALRVAALSYAMDAMTSKDAPGIAAQFTKQARETSDLADRIEENGLCAVMYRQCPQTV